MSVVQESLPSIHTATASHVQIPETAINSIQTEIDAYKQQQQLAYTQQQQLAYTQQQTLNIGALHDVTRELNKLLGVQLDTTEELLEEEAERVANAMNGEAENGATANGYSPLQQANGYKPKERNGKAANTDWATKRLSTSTHRSTRAKQFAGDTDGPFIIRSKTSFRSRQIPIRNGNSPDNSLDAQPADEKKLLPDIQANEAVTYQRHTGSTLEALLSSKSNTQRGLLTADEEKQYGTMVQQLTKIKSVENHAAQVNNRRPSPAEVADMFNMEKEEFIKLKAQCVEARRRMIDCNLRLVVSVAKKKMAKRKGHDLHDLVSAGMNGLSRAVDKFEPKKGYKFSTYAHWWIRQAVDRFVQQQSIVPVHFWEYLSKIRKAQRALREYLDREPDYNEVGKLLGLEPARVEHIVQACRDPDSLDQTVMDGGASMDEILVIDDDFAKGVMGPYGVDDHLKRSREDDHAQQAVQSLLNEALTPKEIEILSMRYGLEDGNPKTLDEVGEHFKVSRERVRQIEARVSRKLKLSKQRDQLKNNYQGGY